MWDKWGIGALIMLSGAAYAGGPHPPPPPGFSGAQYIDGEGCVFTPKGNEWVLRLDDRGVRVCGFPPTLGVRRTDPDTVSVLEPAGGPLSPTELLEEDLLSQFAGGLRAGEFVADHHHEQEKRLAAKPAGDGGMREEVQKLSRLNEAMEVATAGGLANSELCKRLGYEPETVPNPIIGGDVTRGMCPGMHAPTPKMRDVNEIRVENEITDKPEVKIADDASEKPLAEGQVELSLADSMAKPNGGATVPGLPRKPAILADIPAAANLQPQIAVTRPPSPKAKASIAAVSPPHIISGLPHAQPKGATAVSGHPDRGKATSKRPEKTTNRPASATNTVTEAPTSAKYVEVGSFADHDIAAIAMRQLAQMGYPVAKGDARSETRTIRHVLAGPFDDRDSLINALKRLQESGYSGAFLR